MIVIIPHTTAVGGSVCPVLGSVLWRGGGSPGQEGDLRGPKHKDGGGGVGVGGKGSEGKGRTDESASLSFVVQMLAVTVGAGGGS